MNILGLNMQDGDNSKKKKRLAFIDVMRGIAVIWMIETHVIDVVLNDSLKFGSFYSWLSISNGFVAVSFIFCAGAGFWLAAMKKTDDYKNFKPPLFVYIRRLLLILVIGYFLHFPAPSLSGLFNVQPEAWLVFFESDVLQCIVYTSFISLFLLMIIPKLNQVPWVFAFLTIIVIFVSPFVRVWDAMSIMHPFFGTLFSGPPISKFPLVPWSAYFFGGVAATALFMQSDRRQTIAWFYLLLGLSVAAFFINSKSLGVDYPDIDNWWNGSPGHTFFRLFGTLSVFGLLFLLERYYENTIMGKWLKIAGQESLFLYVSHLLIVYNSANIGIDAIFGTNLGYLASFSIFAGITVLCYIGAHWWHNLKRKDMRKARIVMSSTFGLLILFFIFNPF